ncbi:MAG: hypothetical protein ACRBDI_03280 [Alphaproteobacteria bacterium]
MSKKFRKSGHSKTFESSAGKLRRTGSPEYGGKNLTALFSENKQYIKENAAYSFDQTYKPNKRANITPESEEETELPQDRHYSIFQNPDTHTKEEHDHDEGFIKKQKWAAGGVVAVAALADLNQMEKILLGATGAGNVLRNQGWWSAINNVPKNLGRIATLPQYTYAKFLHNTAEAMDTGLYESNKQLFKSWTLAKAKSIKKDNKIKRDAILKLGAEPNDNALKAYLTKISVKTKLAAHYINNSPSYLTAQMTHSMGAQINLNKDSKSILHVQTRGMRKWMRKKSRSIHADNKTKCKAIEKFAKNPIGQDIIVSRLSAAFLAMGTLVHLPQTYMGWNMYQDTGNLNGHLLGAGGVAISYGMLAMHKLREVPRLKEAYNDLKKITKDSWDNRMRHDVIGHIARKEYGQQALFVGLPLIGIMGKGAAYMYESTHLHHWNLESFTSLPDKISKFDAKGALDYLTTTDPMSILHSAANLDYSNAMTMSASAIMFASGYIFLKSGWDETVEDFGRVSKYGFRRYIKDPINQAVDRVRYDVNNTISLASKTEQWIWDKAMRPALHTVTPDWVRAEPYYKGVTSEIRNEVLKSTLDFNDELDTVLKYASETDISAKYYDPYDDFESDEEEDNTPSSPEFS